MVDSNLMFLKNGTTHLQDNSDVRFYLWLVLYNCEDVLFSAFFLNVLEGFKQFNLPIWFMKIQLETPFKFDSVKALIKRQIVKNWTFISLRKFRKLQHLLCSFGFQ